MTTMRCVECFVVTPANCSEHGVAPSRDGCSCRWPVLACAHFGDEWVWLNDWGCKPGPLFDVTISWQDPAFYYGNDRAAAEEAFSRAETELLGRQP